MSVPLRAVGKNFALQIVQGGKQRQCAVAIVIVRARGHVPLAQGKTRLASFQRLALAFLITTQHDGLLRRRQIQADNVPELLLELPVVGQFERASLVRLQIVAEPQLLNPTLGNTRLLGHAPATPPGAVLERLSDLREHGGVSTVFRALAETRAGRPERALSRKPARPCRAKRRRHLQTGCSVVCNSSAICSMVRFKAASSMIRARSASVWLALDARVRASNCSRCT